MGINIKPKNGTIAILIAILAVIILTSTASTISLTWDEPMYITAADSYAAWFDELVKDPSGALTPSYIEKFWSFNHEHPPLEKIWSGLIAKAARHFFDELTASRLGVILMVALLLSLLYLMVAQTYGKAAGIFAAAALIMMPRFFFHAHLAALDVPVAVSSFALTYLFWKTVDKKSVAWGLLWGVVLGLSAATKFNGVLIPVALIVWSLIFRRSWRLAPRFILMGLAALLTFILIWPWLYYDTWTRITEFVNFHLRHYPLGQWYLGQFYISAPWHFTLVILWAVVPVTVIILFLAGSARAGKGDKDGGLAWLLIIHILVLIFPFVAGTSIYDNDRLLMPVFPFIAAGAGIGFGWLTSFLKINLEKFKRAALIIPATAALGIVLLVSQSAAMAGLYPYLLSYYSEGVGGLRGANKLGFETTYWCESYAAALPYINSHARSGDNIWVESWSSNVLIYYQKIGRLRPDVHIITPRGTQSIFSTKSSQSIDINPLNADWFLIQYCQSEFIRNSSEVHSLLQILKTEKPLYGLSVQDVPLMALYGPLHK